MTPETITQFVSELQQAYPGALRGDEAGRVLVKLPKVCFPKGCEPSSTAAIVVLDPAQPKPRVLVRHKPRTPGGRDPRSVNAETVAGESWFTFSFNVVWDETRHTAQQFVESALRRFAKDE